MPEDAHTPIYKRLFERYKDDILGFRLAPGDRIDSIVEMQEKYRVGRETAKRVLGMLAEAGFIIQRRGKGSFVADQRPPKKVLGLVLPHYSIQYEELLHELDKRVRAAGRELRHHCHYNRYEEEIRLVGRMLHERYEAVAVIPTLDESKTWKRFYSKLAADNSSIVLLGHTMTSNDFRFVIQSYDLGITRAMLYMMKEKDGAIAFVENDNWPGRNMVLELMRGTFMELMRTHRPKDAPLILPRAGAIDAAALRKHNITGIFCCDDTCAIQAIGRLTEQGASIPSEFNVVSYGNTDLSRFFTPAITSVDPHNAEMAETLCAQVFGDKTGQLRQHVVHPELVLRET